MNLDKGPQDRDVKREPRTNLTAGKVTWPAGCSWTDDDVEERKKVKGLVSIERLERHKPL